MAVVPFFYRTMGVEEFLDWKIEVGRFFDVIEVPEKKTNQDGFFPSEKHRRHLVG